MKTVLAVVVLATLLSAAPALATGPSRVPPAFLGEWRYEVKDCRNDADDSKMFIRPNRLEFYASEGSILSVKIHSAREVSITARLSGEGETSDEVVRLRMSADGRSIADVSDGEVEPFTRKRCPRR